MRGMSSSTGRLSQEQERYLSWLKRKHAGEDVGTREEWCAANGDIPESTARSWEQSEQFQTAYRKVIQREFSSPEKMMKWLTLLENDAFGGELVNTNIAGKLLDLVEKLRPTVPLEEETSSLADLTDEELFALLINAASIRGWEVTVSADGEELNLT